MTADQWFDKYAESHQNPTNKAIHWVAIPIIFFTVVGLLWSIPVPAAFTNISHFVNFATIGMVLALLFYFRLSIPLGIGMFLYISLNLMLARALDANGFNLPLISIILFVGAWIFQFYGHKVEGKKPSFFTDLQFLLIGPLWLMHFIFRKASIPY
jgi:uncharacterized membrane protein YGL010W